MAWYNTAGPLSDTVSALVCDLRETSMAIPSPLALMQMEQMKSLKRSQRLWKVRDFDASIFRIFPL